MPRPVAAAIPPDLADLLTTNVPASLTLLRADGLPVSHVMWLDYDGSLVLTSSPKSSYKSRALRARPQVAISVFDPADPWRRLSITGRVTGIRDDEGLAFINRLSQRYTGRAYPRLGEREIFEITPETVRAFGGRG